MRPSLAGVIVGLLVLCTLLLAFGFGTGVYELLIWFAVAAVAGFGTARLYRAKHTAAAQAPTASVDGNG